MNGRPSAPDVPGWRILGRIGVGGMGTVWKARRADGTFAAIKVADGAVNAGAAAHGALFRRESLACMNLEHPNLVRGLDVGTTADGRPYLAMEFVEGRTLGRVVRDDGPLPEARLVAVAGGIARALDHAHRLGLLHRDVKPDNVMLTPDGGVKVLDLGLVVESAAPSGPSLGTRNFLPPEVASGGEAVARSDLFSLGATLAFAALGGMPASGEGFAGTKLPDRAGDAELSPGFRAVVERLLRAEPSQRYASASELLLDLDALAAGERPLGAILGAKAALVPRTRRGWIAVAGVVVTGAVVAAIAMRDRPAVAPPPADVPAPAAATEDPRITAARVTMEQFPDDFARVRLLVVGIDVDALAPADRDELARLRTALDERFAAAAVAAAEDRRARSRSAAESRDVAAACAILREWPAHLAGAPQERELADAADRMLEEARAGARSLAAEAEAAVADSEVAGRADGLLPRIEKALARPAFDGDERARLTEAAGLLVAARRRASAIAAAERAAADVVATWRNRVRAVAEDPRPDAVIAMLEFAASGGAPADVAALAARVLEDLLRADFDAAAIATLVHGRPWAGPSGGRLVVGEVLAEPDVEAIVLSPFWGATGAPNGAEELLGGRAQGAAWLLVHGAWAEAVRADRSVAAIVHGADPLPRRPLPPAGRDAGDLTTRGALACGREVSVAIPDDPTVLAWDAARRGRPRPAAPTAGTAALKTAARDAFLDDDPALAWRAATAAAEADPWDAEIAALRSRIVLHAARPLPTTPALLLAFAEGRRAADLDPKLPAAQSAAAEAGVELLALATGRFAADVRPAVAASCEAAANLGREDPRFLRVAGEWHLAEGRADRAALLLRRAAAKAPQSGDILVALARAEHAAGRPERARDALAKAREAFGGELPESAADIEGAVVSPDAGSKK